MRLSLPLAAALACAPMLALAQVPATKPGYQVNLGIATGRGATTQVAQAPLIVQGYLNPANTTLDPAGLPTPVSPNSPLPVTIIGGSSGGSSGPSATTGTASTTAVPVEDAATGGPVAGTSASAPPSGTGLQGWEANIYSVLSTFAGAYRAPDIATPRLQTYEYGLATASVPPSGGAVNANALQIAGVYNSTPLALTTGQGAALRVNARGELSAAPPTVTPQAANTSTVGAANTAITVFTAGSVTHGCDIVNTLSVTLWVDYTGATAVAGSGTAIPLQPNNLGTLSCPAGLTTSVSAVASAAGTFTAVRF